MYMNRVLEVSKASNGFVVSACVPLKPEAKKGDKLVSCCCSEADRQYVCKDVKEVGEVIEALMPLLNADYKTEEEFDSAFAEATDTSSMMAEEDD